MRHRSVTSTPRPARVLATVTLGAVLALAGFAAGSRWGGPVPAAVQAPAAQTIAQPRPAPPTVVTVEARALRTLRGWDSARSAAYAAGSVAALRDLYVAQVGEADVHLLRSYLDRGLRVEGMRMQILSVDVLAHQAGQWRLRVTDRLHAGVAVGNGARVALPQDRASTRVIRLVRGTDRAWRVVEVRG